MTSQTVTITSKHGLHARPAGLIVAAARAHAAAVTITTHVGTSAPAASLLALIGLGVSNGDVVTVAADGDGADAAVEAVATVLRSEL